MTPEHGNAITRARLVLAGFGWRVFLRRYRWPLTVSALAVGLVGALVAVVVLATTSSGTKTATKAAPVVPIQRYASAVAAVPTNHVHGSGTAKLLLRGDTLTVNLDTKGLLNGSPHLAHIHGLGAGTCPTAANARLHNGHLSISTGDGIKQYGETLTSFTQWGSTSGRVPNNVDFNRYPASGDIRYTRTITVSKLVADLIRDGDAVIVVHGIDYNYNHIYDFKSLGVSDLGKSFPGEATAPALCGPLRPASGTKTASTASAGSPATFVASLKPDPGAPSASLTSATSSSGSAPGGWQTEYNGEPDDLAFICHIQASPIRT
jgi:hypothetical protein